MRKGSNWLPAPQGTFSLYIRSYWADTAIPRSVVADDAVLRCSYGTLVVHFATP